MPGARRQIVRRIQTRARCSSEYAPVGLKVIASSGFVCRLAVRQWVSTTSGSVANPSLSLEPPARWAASPAHRFPATEFQYGLGCDSESSSIRDAVRRVLGLWQPARDRHSIIWWAHSLHIGFLRVLASLRRKIALPSDIAPSRTCHSSNNPLLEKETTSGCQKTGESM